MNEQIDMETLAAPARPNPEQETLQDNKVETHMTSMAVWNVPLPVLVGRTFRIAVGVKCLKGCDLTGAEIRVYDDTLAPVATGVLGGIPLSTIEGLYCAEVELRAPDTVGTCQWTVESVIPGAVAHTDTRYVFAFATVKPPEHMITVHVTDKEKKSPIQNAKVILQPYSGYTDESGTVQIGATAGEHKLWIPKVGKYSTFRTTVRVDANGIVEAELEKASPPEA